MRSRREPLLWLQCLALGVIPLELLLIRLLLAGADPGPVPSVERLLTWGVAVLAPAVALWRQPADWGSLLLVRVPTRTRTADQQTLSARQGGTASIVPLIAAAVLLLPLLWWLDDSAGLISEISPLNGSSRLLCLLLSVPVLALIVWQMQQLGQALRLLLMGAGETAEYPAEQLNSERSSFGLQLLQLAPVDWPEAAPKPMATPERTPEPTTHPAAEPSPEPAAETAIGTTAVEPEQRGAEDQGPTLDADISETGRREESELENTPETTPEPSSQPVPEATPEPAAEPAIDATAVEPEQGAEENQGPALDADISETGRGEEIESEMSPEPTPDPTTQPVPEPTPEPSTEPEAETTQEPEPESVRGAAAVEPEQGSEEDQSSALDADISEIDSTAGRETEEHGEQPETGRGEESEPENTPEPTPGGL